jgi:hypothetical protein
MINKTMLKMTSIVVRVIRKMRLKIFFSFSLMVMVLCCVLWLKQRAGPFQNIVLNKRLKIEGTPWGKKSTELRILWSFKEG